MKPIGAALAAVIACACVPAAAADLTYELKSGPGCDSPDAVKTLYAELDRLPDAAPITRVLELIAVGRKAGIMCEMASLEPLAEVGSVGEFTRSSDGATMLIIKYLRANGAPTYSWRQAPGKPI